MTQVVENLDIREIFVIFVVTKQTNETKIFPMISKDKVTEIFCIIDESTLKSR